jgi:predicted nucleic acid-binding protein
MAFRIFLDTDVLLDFALKKDGSARQLMEWAVKGRVQAFITPSNLQIVGYWLVKVYGAVKGKELLSALLADIQVIDIGHEVTLNALHSRINDVGQALKYYAALHHKLDYFITRDRDLLQAAIPALPACSPGEFIQNNS